MTYTEMKHNHQLLTIAYLDFKRTHDINSLKISCCERSKALFDILDKLSASTLHDLFNNDTNPN